jgi:hypothetical protein
LERLVSSNEAAKILGLSLQGVHYRIKQGKLKAKKSDGKTFVYIEENIVSKEETVKENKNYEDIIVLKDEQILFLKKSLKSTRNQYKDEIARLEKNQNKIIEVFQSEINLLQSAFNEMKTIYKVEEQTPSQIKTDVEFGMMDIGDFFIFMKKNNKSDSEIKSIILERIKQGDNRFIFNRDTKEVMIYKSDFVDLL